MTWNSFSSFQLCAGYYVESLERSKRKKRRAQIHPISLGTKGDFGKPSFLVKMCYPEHIGGREKGILQFPFRIFLSEIEVICIIWTIEEHWRSTACRQSYNNKGTHKGLAEVGPLWVRKWGWMLLFHQPIIDVFHRTLFFFFFSAVFFTKAWIWYTDISTQIPFKITGGVYLFITSNGGQRISQGWGSSWC